MYYKKGSDSIIEVDKLYNEDCLDTMSRMKNESVNLIIADPPYNIGKDFGNSSDRQSKDDYLAFIQNQIKEYYRILKPNGSLILYTGKQYNPHYRLEIDKYMTRQNDIVWFYDSSGVQAKKRYGSLYEPIIFATKHKNKYCFNLGDAQIEAYTGSVRKLIDYRKDPPQPYNTKKNCGDVWYFPRVRYRMPEYTKHPTQKPLSICERIVKVHSNEGDLVYIPFAGSGAEVESCILYNRSWVASEMSKRYVEDIIKPRVSNSQKAKSQRLLDFKSQ